MTRYWSEWIDVHKNTVRKIKWSSPNEPDDYRTKGKLLVHYDNQQVIYDPVMYGWYILLSSIEDVEMKIHVLSGVIARMDNDTNSNLFDQLSAIMDLDKLEDSLLIRLHGVVSGSYKNKGYINKEFSPTISCTLLSVITEKHRSRNKKDSWRRSAATHEDVSENEIKYAYKGISETKIKSMEKIVQFTSTTSQETLPSIQKNE